MTLAFPCKSIQLSTQNNKIIKSPFQVHFTISSCCYLESLRNPFKSQWSRFTRVLRLQLPQTKPNRIRPLDAIASESHSSSGRFIPLPPFVPCFIHRHCSLSSSFSESWFLFFLPNFFFFSFAQFNSVFVFSSVHNLSHFQITFCFCFLFFVFCFLFFVFWRPLLLFLSQGVQCNS